jgi:hypothetical protein
VRAQLLGLWPQHPELLCMRAAAALRLRLYETAFADATLALADDRELHEAAFIAAEAALRLRNPEHAAELYARARDLAPESPQYIVRAICLF